MVITLGAVVLRAALNTYQLWREHKTRLQAAAAGGAAAEATAGDDQKTE